MQFRSPIGYVAVAGVVALILGVFVLPALPQFSQTETQASSPAHYQRSPYQHSPMMAHMLPNAAMQQPGKIAPDFSLPDQNGIIHSLSDAKGKWVVLAFYPMDGSLACTQQNKSYTAQKDQFAPLNAVVYTVSCQDVASKRDFALHAALSHTRGKCR